MNEYETKIFLMDEEYPALVTVHDGEIWRVIMTRSILRHYDANGKYTPHIDSALVDVTALLNDSQRAALAEQIKAELVEG